MYRRDKYLYSCIDKCKQEWESYGKYRKEKCIIEQKCI